jgi:hypothetical protein
MSRAAAAMMATVLMYCGSANAELESQAWLDERPTEETLCPTLAEYYENRDIDAYLSIVDEIKKRGYGRKCLLIAEFEMMSENLSLLVPFKLTLQEVFDEDYPRENRRREKVSGAKTRP